MNKKNIKRMNKAVKQLMETEVPMENIVFMNNFLLGVKEKDNFVVDEKYRLMYYNKSLYLMELYNTDFNTCLEVIALKRTVETLGINFGANRYIDTPAGPQKSHDMFPWFRVESTAEVKLY
jgi:hypothetical protein